MVHLVYSHGAMSTLTRLRSKEIGTVQMQCDMVNNYTLVLEQQEGMELQNGVSVPAQGYKGR